MLPVEQPFKTYTGLDGKPLENGFVYFGEPNQNPITKPITVYWDAAGTIPAAQPLRTVGGYIMRAGTPANVYFDGAYSTLVQDSKGRQVSHARTSDEFSIVSAVANFISSLAAAAGASLIGYIQAGVGAVRQTVQDGLRERVSITQFGAKTSNTAEQNDVALQACMDAVSLVGGGIMRVPAGTFLFSKLIARSNVMIAGSGTLQQVQGPLTQAGIYKASGEGSLSNFRIRDITLDGARVANPGYQYNAIVSFEVGADERLDDISIKGVKFRDAQDHFIRVVAYHSTARGNGFTVRGCTFETTPGKRSLGGTSGPVSMDAVRFEQAWDYSTGGNGYGTVHFTNIDVSANRAESIRTLADIKRGSAFFAVMSNFTRNMYDCHHSVDGSFHGVIGSNVCVTDSDYAGPSTFTNFMEAQGAHLIISDNVCYGGGKVSSGIFVSDYGRPQENGVGRRSVAVTLTNNTVKDITGNAYRILNGDSCSIYGGHVENIGGHVATVESGTGRTNGAIPLVATGCTISGVSSKNAALGVRFAGTNHIKGVNPDENGQDYLYLPGFALADTFAHFITDGATDELCPNPLLETTGTAPNNLKWFESDFYPAVSTAATKPPGVINAVTLTDDSTGQLRATYVLLPATVGNRIYARSHFKKNSANACGIVVEERNAAGATVASSFYGTSAPPAAWTAYMVGHKVANANTAYLRIGYLPAAASNDPAQAGATDVAKLQISRVAIGR